jgi:UrcA family protein
MGKMNRKSWLSSLLVIGVAVPAIGLAATPSQLDDVSIRVSYADLNIQSEAGAKVLYSRLKRASEQACGIQSHVINGSLVATLRARNCFRDTLEASVEKIDSEALTEIHSG